MAVLSEEDRWSRIGGHPTRAAIRKKIPRARETSRAFQSALAEEMRRMALEDA